MTLDSLDAAFVDRWHAATAIPPPTTATVIPPPLDDFVDRLLAAAPAAWAGLADEVIAARSRGRRTIAVVACERAAGCSTIAEALVRFLRRLGRDAEVCAATAASPTGPTHDKRIVLVDGGVWFPPGRIHRHRLLVASSGCDAAMLVIRSGGRAPAAWSTCLAAIGVEPLGEVRSFVPDGEESQA